MSTSIRYLPPTGSPPMRNSPISGGRPQYSPQKVMAPGNVPRPINPNNPLNHDIDQQMRMFMAEKSRGISQMPPSARQQRTWIQKPYPGAPVHAPSGSWGPSPRSASRNEMWKAGGSPPPIELDSSTVRPIPPPRPARNELDSWPVVPPRSNRASSDESRSASSSLEGRNGEYSRWANTSIGRVVSTDARSFRSMSTASMSPPPTPPAKDEHWKEGRSPKPLPKSHMDSVILPPPPSSLMPQRSNSLRRQNNPNLRIAVPHESGKVNADMQPPKTPGKKRKSPRSTGKDTTMLENMLGIYPAENKLPPGRSAADELVSKIATKFTKSKSGSQDSLSLSSKSVPTPINSKETTPTENTYPPTQPWTAGVGQFVYSQTDGMIIAELPGSTPVVAEHPRRKESPPTDRQSHRKANSSSEARSKSKGRKFRKGNRLAESLPPPGPPPPPPPSANGHKYANMPLPAPPPAASTSASPPKRGSLKLDIPNEPAQMTEDDAKKFRMTGNFSPDANYGKDIADWAESFYQDDASPSGSESPESASGPKIRVDSKPMVDPASRASVLNPEGAVRGMLLPQPGSRNRMSRATRRSTVRLSAGGQRAMSMTPSEWGSRTSYASSIGDAFQYDAFSDPGLGTIGEDDSSESLSLKEESDYASKITDEYSLSTSDIEDELSSLPETLDDDDDVSYYNGYDRESMASTALLDDEIDAILGNKRDTLRAARNSSRRDTKDSYMTMDSRRDTAMTTGTDTSEYSYYNASTPSTPGLLDAEIDQLLAESTALNARQSQRQSQRMSAILEHGFGFDISDLDIDDERKTRYLAGRNSEMGEADILFCFPSSEMKTGYTEKEYRY